MGCDLVGLLLEDFRLCLSTFPIARVERKPVGLIIRRVRGSILVRKRDDDERINRLASR